jgi:hypothetical protein
MVAATTVPTSSTGVKAVGVPVPDVQLTDIVTTPRTANKVCLFMFISIHWKFESLARVVVNTAQVFTNNLRKAYCYPIVFFNTPIRSISSSTTSP